VFGFPREVYGLSLLLAVISTVMPAFLLTKGIALLGSGPASIVSGVGPVSTIALAYFVLNEPISVPELCGTALVLSGAILIARHG
jgi:drug/metabolite transporter (DMT)-like permease